MSSHFMWRHKNDHNLDNIGHSDRILFVYLGQLPVHIYVKFDGSMINYVDRTGCKYKKKKVATISKWKRHR